MRATGFRYLALASVLLFSSVPGESRPREITPNAEVTVFLRTTVVSTPGAIERAKLVAQKMFEAVGVAVHWRAPGSAPEPGISVDVLMANDDSREDDSGPLAEAFPFAGKTGHITVRYDRVRNSAGACRDLEPMLLAHVLVHELTHVLQCLDRHADSGVMKAHWTSEDYYEMRWKPLAFTEQDVQLIRLGMEVLRSRTDGRVHTESLQEVGGH